MGFVWNVLLTFSDDEFWDDGDDEPRAIPKALAAINAWIKDGRLVDLTPPTFRRGAGAGMEARLYGGGFKHFDIDGFIETVRKQDWKDRKSVQLFICGGDSRPFQLVRLKSRRKSSIALTGKPKVGSDASLKSRAKAAGTTALSNRRRKSESAAV